jgi:exonuclease VII large subunit
VKANVAEFSVSELAQAVKRALESGFGHVRLRGEISGIAARTPPATLIFP